MALRTAPHLSAVPQNVLADQKPFVAMQLFKRPQPRPEPAGAIRQPAVGPTLHQHAVAKHCSMLPLRCTCWRASHVRAGSTDAVGSALSLFASVYRVEARQSRHVMHHASCEQTSQRSVMFLSLMCTSMPPMHGDGKRAGSASVGSVDQVTAKKVVASTASHASGLSPPAAHLEDAEVAR